MTISRLMESIQCAIAGGLLGLVLKFYGISLITFTGGLIFAVFMFIWCVLDIVRNFND